MNCYICEKTPGSGGTHYHVKAAVGICHNCSIAVCLEHSHRDPEFGSPLLCSICTRLLKEPPISEATRAKDILEALLCHNAGDRFEFFSAGLEPKGVNPYTILVIDEVGLDISNHTSDHVDAVVGTRYFSYIITVCADTDDRCPSEVYALEREKLHWPFDDPAAATGDDEEIIAKFRTVCDRAHEVCPTFPGEGQHIHWVFTDPAAIEDPHARQQAFAKTAKRLQARIQHYLTELKTGA